MTVKYISLIGPHSHICTLRMNLPKAGLILMAVERADGVPLVLRDPLGDHCGQDENDGGANHLLTQLSHDYSIFQCLRL